MEKEIAENKAARNVRRISRWGIPLGFLFCLTGYLILSKWGTSWKESTVYWYRVHSEELNAFGVLGIVFIGTGVTFFILWLFAVVRLKSSVPCPKCRGLLQQRTSMCPYCKTALDWEIGTEAQIQKGAYRKLLFCPSCGTKAADGDIYCRNCSYRLGGKNV